MFRFDATILQNKINIESYFLKRLMYFCPSFLRNVTKNSNPLFIDRHPAYQGPVAFLVPFWVGSGDGSCFLGFIAANRRINFNGYSCCIYSVGNYLRLLTLLSYKTRTKQIVYNRLNIVINFLLLGIIVYHLLKLPGGTVVSEKGIGVFIPLLVIVFLALANKAIIKDDKLVKSVDRLR